MQSIETSEEDSPSYNADDDLVQSDTSEMDSGEILEYSGSISDIKAPAANATKE